MDIPPYKISACRPPLAAAALDTLCGASISKWLSKTRCPESRPASDCRASASASTGAEAVVAPVQMKNCALDSLASPYIIATPPNSTPSIKSASVMPSRSIVIVQATSRMPLS